MKVMIDPGHAPGNPNSGNNGYWEYAGMWKLSNYLLAAFGRCGINADLARTENEDPSLEARGKKAEGCDLFISEHSNAGGGKGVECYYSIKRPSDAQNAALLSDRAAAVMNTLNRGAKTRTGDGGLDYYGVIRAAAATDAKHIFLMENGFHDNAADEAFLLKDENLKKLAETQAEVICGIFGVVYKSDAVAAHFAEASWERLNQIGVTIYEKRFDDPITRGEAFVLLDRVTQL